MGRSTICSHAYFTAVEIPSEKTRGAPGLQDIPGGVVFTLTVTGQSERFYQIYGRFHSKPCADIFIEIG